MSPSAVHPPPHTWLCELDTEPLSLRADEALRRLAMFLCAIQRPHLQTPALLAGYDEQTHLHGAYLASWIAGEQSLERWRITWALKPRVDPDLPDEIAALEAFVAAWQPRALAAVEVVEDPGDREEVRSYLGGELDRPSRVWRASAWIARVEHLAKVPADGYETTWRALVAEGFVPELARANEVLETVRRSLAEGPLLAGELAAIHAARESSAADAERWLAARRVQLAGHLSAESLFVLALDEGVPPPLPAGVHIADLAGFAIAAKA
jgi:hypothetical protein